MFSEKKRKEKSFRGTIKRKKDWMCVDVHIQKEVCWNL